MTDEQHPLHVISVDFTSTALLSQEKYLVNSEILKMRSGDRYYPQSDVRTMNQRSLQKDIKKILENNCRAEKFRTLLYPTTFLILLTIMGFCRHILLQFLLHQIQ